MEIKIISFGKIAEYIEMQQIDAHDLANTGALRIYLEDRFPNLKGAKYKLSLNNQLVQTDLPLKDQDIVAIMPPFSGG